MEVNHESGVTPYDGIVAVISNRRIVPEDKRKTSDYSELATL